MLFVSKYPFNTDLLILSVIYLAFFQEFFWGRRQDLLLCQFFICFWIKFGGGGKVFEGEQTGL